MTPGATESVMLSMPAHGGKPDSPPLRPPEPTGSRAKARYGVSGEYLNHAKPQTDFNPCQLLHRITSPSEMTKERYWLMKSEPNEYSISDLENEPGATDHWDGVRNYQARNMMRDDMKLGDQIFFYHSNCEIPGIVGVMQVAREAYPDFTAFDPNDKHFDPKSDPNAPRWFMVDVQFGRKLKRSIPLRELKEYPELQKLALIRRGNRLSIMPVSKAEWEFILSLE